MLLPSRWRPTAASRASSARTKPYGYSLFNLEAMATICQILSTPEDDLWTFELPDGRGMRKAMAFMVPFIRDKKWWPKPPDVHVRQELADAPGEPALRRRRARAARVRGSCGRTLPADSDVEEVVRNFFIRQPLLWFDELS